MCKFFRSFKHCAEKCNNFVKLIFKIHLRNLHHTLDSFSLRYPNIRWFAIYELNTATNTQNLAHSSKSKSQLNKHKFKVNWRHLDGDDAIHLYRFFFFFLFSSFSLFVLFFFVPFRFVLISFFCFFSFNGCCFRFLFLSRIVYGVLYIPRSTVAVCYVNISVWVFLSVALASVVCVWFPVFIQSCCVRWVCALDFKKEQTKTHSLCSLPVWNRAERHIWL